MAANQETAAAVKNVEQYKYGFVTDIESDMAPKGLSEDIVRFISAKKGEPEWLLEWRLRAYRHWLTMTEPKWREAWDLKVFGYVNCTRAMLEKFYARKKGVIVNIIGLAGESFNYDYVAGTMGNAGLIAFTRAVGSRSVEHGVSVVAINPPATRTDRMLTLLTGQAQQKFGDPNRWPELTTHMPFGRPAEPDEVADLAVFLASDRASYISGVVMTLDGGQAAKH